MKTNCAIFFKSVCIKLGALRMNLHQEIALSFKKFSDPCHNPNLSLAPNTKLRVHKLGYRYP